jgi:ABC-type Fe3+/spermidine/putrescine transport system ATPase subunit
MTSPTLEVSELNAGYGDVAVLRDVTMQVRSGSVVALLGPNGAGKTTLLRVISGLLRPTQGRVLLGGRDVTDLRAEQLAQLGMCHVPEGRGIFPSLSVKENLLLFAPKLTRDEIAERTLGAFPTLGSRMSLATDACAGPRLSGQSPTGPGRRSIDGSGTLNRRPSVRVLERHRAARNRATFGRAVREPGTCSCGSRLHLEPGANRVCREVCRTGQRFGVPAISWLRNGARPDVTSSKWRICCARNSRVHQ